MLDGIFHTFLESGVWTIVIWMGPDTCVVWQKEWIIPVSHQVPQGGQIPSESMAIKKQDVWKVSVTEAERILVVNELFWS